MYDAENANFVYSVVDNLYSEGNIQLNRNPHGSVNMQKILISGMVCLDWSLKTKLTFHRYYH